MPTYNLEEPSVQHDFFFCRKPIQIFGGGFGNGKTAAMCIKNINIARDYPGCNLLMGRSTYPKLNDTLRKEFFKWCPMDWIRRMPTKDDNTCYLVNGSTINFRYIAQRGKQTADGATTSNLLSATFDAITIDQLEDPEITYKDFRDMIGRLRGSTQYRPPHDVEPDPTMPLTGPRFLMLSCNPTHNWVYKKLVLPYIMWRDRGIVTDDLLVDPESKEPIIELFEGPTDGNAHNLPEDFIRNLRASYTGQMYDRFFLGKWAAYEGLVYPGFRSDVHMVDPSDIALYQRQLFDRGVRVTPIEAYDYGMAVPSCFLRGFVDDLGRVVWTHGYYKKEFLLEEQAERIKELRVIDPYNVAKDIMHEIVKADPACFKRNPVAGKKKTGQSIADIFWQDYRIRFEPASNDIASGIAKVASYLADQDAPNPFTGAARGPFMYFSRALTFVEDEFNNYFWSKNTHGDIVDQPMDRDDHAMDVIKYGLADRPNPADIVFESVKGPPPWMFWHEARENV